MGQGEIIEFLEKQVEPISCREIAEELDERFEKISSTLRRLLKSGEVDFIELNRHEARERFDNNIKRRMRLFFILN